MQKQLGENKAVTFHICRTWIGREKGGEKMQLSAAGRIATGFSLRLRVGTLGQRGLSTGSACGKKTISHSNQKMKVLTALVQQPTLVEGGILIVKNRRGIRFSRVPIDSGWRSGSLWRYQRTNLPLATKCNAEESVECNYPGCMGGNMPRGRVVI